MSYTTKVKKDSAKSFREVCEQHQIAVTHQRQVLYEVMQRMAGHPSPEEICDRVRQIIPSISLATVYKNIHVFVEAGVFREMSLHHGSVRLEMNRTEHHHAVCSACKSVVDIDEHSLGLVTKRRKLPGGFRVERYSVDVIGVCAACQAAGAG